LKLWNDLDKLDSLALEQNKLELNVWRVEDDAGTIAELHIESIKYGISWNIEVDSTLNSIQD